MTCRLGYCVISDLQAGPTAPCLTSACLVAFPCYLHQVEGGWDEEKGGWDESSHMSLRTISPFTYLQDNTTFNAYLTIQRMVSSLQVRPAIPARRFANGWRNTLPPSTDTHTHTHTRTNTISLHQQPLMCLPWRSPINQLSWSKCGAPCLQVQLWSLTSKHISELSCCYSIPSLTHGACSGFWGCDQRPFCELLPSGKSMILGYLLSSYLDSGRYVLSSWQHFGYLLGSCLDCGDL